MNALYEIVWFKSVMVTSSVCLLLGWVMMSLWRRHAGRAYQILLLCVLAAVCVPMLSLAVHEFNMGLLPAGSRILAMPTWANLSSVGSTSSSILETAVNESSRQAAPQPDVQSSPEPVETTSPHFWTDFIFWVWPLLTVVFLLRVVVAFVSGVLRVKKAQPVDVMPNGVDLPGLKASLGIARPVGVAVSQAVYCPVVWCWGRSVTIVVPLDFWISILSRI